MALHVPSGCSLHFSAPFGLLLATIQLSYWIEPSLWASSVLILPSLQVVNELVKETNCRKVGVDVDTLVDSVEVEQLGHGRRRKAVNVA